MADNARILLVGPQVSRLGPFVEERGYMAVCREGGNDALSFLEAQECDLIVLELELGDLVAREFMKEARRHRPELCLPGRDGLVSRAGAEQEGAGRSMSRGAMADHQLHRPRPAAASGPTQRAPGPALAWRDGPE